MLLTIKNWSCLFLRRYRFYIIQFTRNSARFVTLYWCQIAPKMTIGRWRLERLFVSRWSDPLDVVRSCLLQTRERLRKRLFVAEGLRLLCCSQFSLKFFSNLFNRLSMFRFGISIKVTWKNDFFHYNLWLLKWHDLISLYSRTIKAMEPVDMHSVSTKRQMKQQAVSRVGHDGELEGVLISLKSDW